MNKKNFQRGPRVSVLIRTMDRASLIDTIASVQAQTHTDWELLIVNASGHPLTALPPNIGSSVSSVIEPGKKLGRSAAANALLDAANGKYALFLDDDDVLLPCHLQKLAGVLDLSPNLNACYSDVKATMSPNDGRTDAQVHLYTREFDPVLLQFQNYLPIHSMMFRLDVVRQPLVCRFDENLDLFEDWDFWLQLALKGPFQRVSGVSALYVLNESNGSSHAQIEGLSRESMLTQFGQRQLDRWHGADVAGFISWQGKQINEQEQTKQELSSLTSQMEQVSIVHTKQLEEMRVEISHLSHSLLAQQEANSALEKNAQTARAYEFAQQMEIEKLGRIRLEHLHLLDSVYQSTSWRLTRPLRGFKRVWNWLARPAARQMPRNALNAVRVAIQRHGLIGFIYRLPRFLRNHKMVAVALNNQVQRGDASLFKSQAIVVREMRLHPDLSESKNPIDASISIVIPTYNAGLEFRWLLRKLQTQKGLRKLEIVIVDSGSQDQTVVWARAAGCHVVEITQAEFTHSHARNLGAANASSDYLIFMVQDAYPIGEYWAYGMLRYLLDHENEGLVAASCSEYSRSDSDMMYDSMINTHYQFLGCHEHDRIGDFQGSDHMTLRSRGQLSDVACLISRQMFGKYGYQGDYAEDLDLGIRLIKDGYKVAMLASVKVVHSHNRAAYYYLKRSYVDVIFLVGMFDDFLIPQMDSLRGLVAGIVSCASHVSELMPLLKESHPSITLSETLGNWIFHCREKSKALRIDGHSNFGDARLDKYIDDLRNRLTPASLGDLASIEALRFAESFFARLEHFNMFAAETFGKQDAKLRAGLQDAICKIFASAAGSALGFMFMDKQGTTGSDQAMMELINSELRAGV